MTLDVILNHRRDCKGEQQCQGPREQAAKSSKRFLIKDLDEDRVCSSTVDDRARRGNQCVE